MHNTVNVPIIPLLCLFLYSTVFDWSMSWLPLHCHAWVNIPVIWMSWSPLLVYCLRVCLFLYRIWLINLCNLILFKMSIKLLNCGMVYDSLIYITVINKHVSSSVTSHVKGTIYFSPLLLVKNHWRDHCPPLLVRKKLVPITGEKKLVPLTGEKKLGWKKYYKPIRRSNFNPIRNLLHNRFLIGL